MKAAPKLDLTDEVQAAQDCLLDMIRLELVSSENIRWVWRILETSPQQFIAQVKQLEKTVATWVQK